MLLGTCAMKGQHSRSWFILNDQNQLKNRYHFEFPLKDHLPVLVLDHNSNFCRGDCETCEYGAVLSNSSGAKFFVSSLEMTIISKEDQLYAILFQVNLLYSLR